MGCMCDMLESLTWFKVLYFPIEALVDLYQILEIILCATLALSNIFILLICLGRYSFPVELFFQFLY